MASGMAPRTLGTASDTRRRAYEILRKRWHHLVSEGTEVFAAEIDRRKALVALARDRFVIVTTGLTGREESVPYASITGIEATGRTVEIVRIPRTSQITVESAEDAARLTAELERARVAGGARAAADRSPAPDAPAPVAADSPPAIVIPRQRSAPEAESLPVPAGDTAADAVAAPAADILVVTTDDIPGHQIVEIHVGVAVRGRADFTFDPADPLTTAAGALESWAEMLRETRAGARDRLAAEAVARGANAVVAMRFDCSDVGDHLIEIAAYGTAVTVEPGAEDAPPTGGRHRG
jgi:uncharacterized protein YbjQ (UPF0145 family)